MLSVKSDPLGRKWKFSFTLQKSPLFARFSGWEGLGRARQLASALSLRSSQGTAHILWPRSPCSLFAVHSALPWEPQWVWPALLSLGSESPRENEITVLHHIENECSHPRNSWCFSFPQCNGGREIAWENRFTPSIRRNQFSPGPTNLHSLSS